METSLSLDTLLDQGDLLFCPFPTDVPIFRIATPCLCSRKITSKLFLGRPTGSNLEEVQSFQLCHTIKFTQLYLCPLYCVCRGCLTQSAICQSWTTIGTTLWLVDGRARDCDDNAHSHSNLIVRHFKSRARLTDEKKWTPNSTSHLRPQLDLKEIIIINQSPYSSQNGTWTNLNVSVLSYLTIKGYYVILNDLNCNLVT